MSMSALQRLSRPCALHSKATIPASFKRPQSRAVKRARRCEPTRAMDPRPDGDFGARDPTASETESNFGAKVLGNADTSHIIRGPKGLEKLVGLATKKCVPLENGNAQAMDENAAYTLRNQVLGLRLEKTKEGTLSIGQEWKVPGWRLEKTKEGTLCIRQEWKVKDAQSGNELLRRMNDIADAEGHHPNLHMEGDSMLLAELSTHSIGGLSVNDFIMAAKFNDIPVADLQPKAKPRFWA